MSSVHVRKFTGFNDAISNNQSQKSKSKSLYLSVRVFSTVVLIVDTVNKQTNITNTTVT